MIINIYGLVYPSTQKLFMLDKQELLLNTD